MDIQELRELCYSSLTLDNPLELKRNLNGFFLEADLSFPALILEGEARVKRLKPLNENARKTVRNYLDCLEAINDHNYTGSIGYMAIPSDSKTHSGNLLFVARLFDQRKEQSFNLTLQLDHIGEEPVYQASSKIRPTEFTKFCKPYEGPNEVF